VNSQKLNDWLQIVGLFGVIGSLIFVGLQLRQTQAIALSETYQSRTATAINANVGIMSSPAALSGVSKVYRNEFDKLTMPEAVALEQLIGSSLAMLENNQLQFQQGFLSDEHWQRNIRELRCMLTVPLFREIATSWEFRDSFNKVISHELQKVPPDAENCWSYENWEFPMN
jgi:hypothetical protein